MSFHFKNRKGLLIFAVLLLGFLPLALAQSATPGQPILFSSPDGGTASNAILPAATAPAQAALANMPVAPVSVFNDHSSDAISPVPAPAAFPSGNNAQNSTDPQNNLKLLTPAEIMDVPTPEKIFGLPESDTKKNTAGQRAENTQTNDFSSEQSGWSKFLYGNDAKANTTDAGGAENSSGILSRLFNGAPDGGLLGDPNKTADAIYGLSPQPVQTPAQPEVDQFQQLLEPLQSSEKPADSSDMNFYRSPAQDSVFAQPANSGSPLALPKGGSLAKSPQLPKLPSVSSQNSDSTQPVAPSWAPKPAPWLSPVPPLGTIPQRKF
jgi:hypothetical protein